MNNQGKIDLPSSDTPTTSGSFHAQSPATETKCTICDWDIGKSLVGTFTGAGLAFLSNWWFQRRAKIQDNLASGRRALFTIRSQLDDLANYRYGLVNGISIAHRFMPGAVEWMLAKPIGFNFHESNTFDFKSLTFLLATRSGREIFAQLQFIERAYLDIMARHTDFNDSALELQKTLAPFHREHGSASIAAMEAHIGLELIARVRDQQRAVVLRVDRDEGFYRIVFDKLSALLIELYGTKAEMPKADILDKYKQVNLPPLPPSLRAYVDSIPKEPERE